MKAERNRRLYDEKYDSSPKSNTVSGLIKRTERSLDRLVDSDYKQYRNTKRGINDISKLSDKELKYLSRDFKIKGINDPSLKNEIAFRKERTKLLRANRDITPLYSFKSNDQNFSIGYDHKKKQHVLSSRYHNDDKRLPVWRNLDTSQLDKELQQFKPLTGFDIQKHNTSQYRNDTELTKATKSLNNKLEKQLTTTASKEIFTPLNQETLSEPKSLVGKNVQIDDLNNEKSSFKVLAADKENLTLEKTFGTDDNYRLLNINKEMTKSIAQNTKATAILDSKTIMGYNKENGNTYVGRIGKNDTVKWQTKEDYMKELSPTGKTAFENTLKEGSYAVPEVKTLGTTPQGNKIYEVKLANDKKAMAVNLDRFIDMDSPEAKQLKKYVNANNLEKGNAKGLDKSTGKNLLNAASKSVSL